mmetsp:Transcript_2738/g.7622  ORF Transcript_2738/g.7622 Transcript_2738/m.7622 type:complete len:256 (+) Transcript_2738:1189-1956(+)
MMPCTTPRTIDVGDAVGTWVGVAVGTAVGVAVGLKVGSDVGDAVGVWVARGVVIGDGFGISVLPPGLMPNVVGAWVGTRVLGARVGTSPPPPPGASVGSVVSSRGPMPESGGSEMMGPVVAAVGTSKMGGRVCTTNGAGVGRPVVTGDAVAADGVATGEAVGDEVVVGVVLPPGVFCTSDELPPSLFSRHFCNTPTMTVIMDKISTMMIRMIAIFMTVHLFRFLRPDTAPAPPPFEGSGSFNSVVVAVGRMETLA